MGVLCAGPRWFRGIAHPDFRESLAREARDKKLVPAGPL
jgi:acyl-CoA hydrolase